MLFQAGPILRDFSARWKDAIEDMHKEVAKHFAHVACGRDVLQVGVALSGLCALITNPLHDVFRSLLINIYFDELIYFGDAYQAS